ncbi:MAG: helix-turn-helix transcriptional regulator [Syntrophorhabdales bacterium]|jgi:transcriptional regulator with XRE-family HTH domain
MREPGEIDWKFKMALAEAGLSERKLGDLVGTNHTLLSMYAHGRYILSIVERRKISRVLGKPEEQVFDGQGAAKNKASECAIAAEG